MITLCQVEIRHQNEHFIPKHISHQYLQDISNEVIF